METCDVTSGQQSVGIVLRTNIFLSFVFFLQGKKKVLVLTNAEGDSFARGLCTQLLTLGYGRRELHPNCVSLFDKQLDYTDSEILPQLAVGNKTLAQELNSLVKWFDAGPLKLLLLTRIAIRCSIGGSQFAVRVASRKEPPAASAFEVYVDPKDLLFLDYSCIADANSPVNVSTFRK